MESCQASESDRHRHKLGESIYYALQNYDDHYDNDNDHDDAAQNGQAAHDKIQIFFAQKISRRKAGSRATRVRRGGGGEEKVMIVQK